MKVETIFFEELRDIHPEAFQHIKKYYHVGSSLSDKDYHDRHKAIHDLIHENVINNHNYEHRWKNGFCKQVSKSLGLPVSDSGGLSPAWGGSVKLPKSTEDIGPTLHFYVSYLCNYYFICVNEGCQQDDLDQTLPNSITVSPHGAFKKEMEKVDQLIRDWFDHARFLPYIFDMIRIHSFQVPYLESTDCSVHEAFFYKYENSFSEKLRIHGDIYYGFN